MKTATAWRAGSATDPGLERSINEDRVLVDDVRGVFSVVDGLGGHAAGEVAAETAVRVLNENLSGGGSFTEDRIRRAITSANNEIYQQAKTNPAWQGMACVLTLAAVSGDRVTVGHVGDSRLYLMSKGKLRKITCDHSPVGELEDSGELTEEQAMRHPRRNEVFRDVGSYIHAPGDADFIETKSFAFRSDSALLLCSDGLSDFVNAAQIANIINGYDGDPNRVAQLLVEAANSAGGRDNISVVFVPGAEFLGSHASALDEVRARHATTRMRNEPAGGAVWIKNFLLVLIGMALGLVLWRLLERNWSRLASPQPEAVVLRAPKTIAVDPADSLGIIKALSSALPGDTVDVPAGEYLGPLLLKDGVNVVARPARRAIVRSDPSSSADAGVAILARGLKESRLKGLRIVGDDTHPLRTGLLIADSSLEASDLEISGAIDSGVRIEGDSHPLVLGSYLHGNSGPGAIIRSPSAPRLVGDRISENGLAAGALRAGIEMDADAQPVFENNQIVQNGLPPLFPPALEQEIRNENTVEKVKPDKPKAGKPKAATGTMAR